MAQKHFDGWGNPTSDYFRMLSWFAGDERSLKVLRSEAPFRTVCLPSVEIEMRLPCDGVITVRRAWPGGSLVNRIVLGEHGLNALRRLFKAPRGCWKVSRGENVIIWKRRPALIKCAWSNYYPVGRSEG